MATSGTTPYVALGDSYAAGVGGGAEVDACWRAVRGYPVLVASALGVGLAYDACIGATTSDVLADQLLHLREDTTYVSITIGGNDIGFVPVLVAAAEPSWLNDSDDDIDRALVTLRTKLPDRLDAVYAAIRERAPDAHVVVTTYPRLFNGTDCNPATFFSRHEMTRLNGAANQLATVISTAAAGAGFDVARVGPVFVGHAICDSTSWLHGVTVPVKTSFHPNRTGHASYARVVREAFGAADQVAPGPEPLLVLGPDRPGSAPVFSLPDLLSERSLSGAAAHGLDPDEVSALARTVQRPALRTGREPDPEIAEAYERLHDLDARVAHRRWPRREH